VSQIGVIAIENRPLTPTQCAVPDRIRSGATMKSGKRNEAFARLRAKKLSDRQPNILARTIHLESTAKKEP